MSLPVVQLSGKVNKLPLSNTILLVLVGSTPCKHRGYLTETWPMPIARRQIYHLPKNGACLSPTARRGSQPSSRAPCASGRVNSAPSSHAAPSAWPQHMVSGFGREASLLRHNQGTTRPRLSPARRRRAASRTDTSFFRLGQSLSCSFLLQQGGGPITCCFSGTGTGGLTLPCAPSRAQAQTRAGAGRRGRARSRSRRQATAGPGRPLPPPRGPRRSRIPCTRQKNRAPHAAPNNAGTPPLSPLPPRPRGEKRGRGRCPPRSPSPPGPGAHL